MQDMLYDVAIGKGSGPFSCATDPSGLNPAQVQDCQQAIAMLKGSSSQCSVLATDLEPTRTDVQKALAAKGDCAVVMGGPIGSGLSCIRAAEDAGQLGTACATFQQPTAGSYEYPENKWHLAKRIFWCDLQHVEYCKKESTVAYMLSKPR